MVNGKQYLLQNTTSFGDIKSREPLSLVIVSICNVSPKICKQMEWHLLQAIVELLS